MKNIIILLTITLIFSCNKTKIHQRVKSFNSHDNSYIIETMIGELEDGWSRYSFTYDAGALAYPSNMIEVLSNEYYKAEKLYNVLTKTDDINWKRMSKIKRNNHE